MAFVVFAGQSNTGGYGVDASDLRATWQADPLTLIWDAAAKAWAPLNPGVNTGYGQSPNTWGPEVEFARQFRELYPNEELRIVKVANGGSQLAVDAAAWHYDWSPDSRDEYFDQVTRTIADAAAPLGGVRPSFVFWGQGEEDARYEDAARAYGANLTGLFGAIRSQWMADANGKIGFFQIGVSPTYSGLVREAQQAVDRLDPNATSFDTYLYPTQPDALHLSAFSHDRVGFDAFQAYANFRAGVTSQAGQSATGTDGADSLIGGMANDTFAGGAGEDFIRGNEGADLLIGNGAFDDMHGNQGDDTLFGGDGGDWVVGGKDQDRLYGEDGGDVVLGNLGRDILDGGAGNDVVRGGQGDDVVYGGSGDDFVSGDRGDDIIFGGLGADRFHVFDGSGMDLAMDFNRADGDRVEVLPGATWTVAEVGGDVVVTVDGTGQLVLVGVSLSSLTGDWIGT